MSFSSFSSAFEIYKPKSEGVDDNVSIRSRASTWSSMVPSPPTVPSPMNNWSEGMSPRWSTPPPLPKSRVEHFDPFSAHYIPSPNAYEPRLAYRKQPMPHHLDLKIDSDGSLHKMVVDSPDPSDSAAAHYVDDASPKPVTRRKPLFTRRRSWTRKPNKKTKEAAGIV